MNRTTPPSSSADPTTAASPFTLGLPTAWTALTDTQLAALCSLAAQGLDPDTLRARFLTLHLLSPEQRALFAPADLLPAADLLDWMDTPPDTPIRCAALHGRTALDAALHDVPFRTYLMADNCFQGWLATAAAAPLHDMARLLYPLPSEAPEPEDDEPLTPGECYRIALWWTGLKSLLARTFPHLLRPAPTTDADESPDPAEAMNAQIRALTAGDITKEECVLAADTWRALTELDAKAREAQELNERLKH